MTSPLAVACASMPKLPEQAAFAMIGPMVQRCSPDQRCDVFDTLVAAREWSIEMRPNLEQLRARLCPDAPPSSGCGCGPKKLPKKLPPMSSTIATIDCGAYASPEQTTAIEQLITGTACKQSECEPGNSIGLTRVPMRLSLAPGATQVVNVGFSRSAYLVALTFLPSELYDFRNWEIGVFETSLQSQAWELYREGTTFGSPSYNPNTDFFPLEWFLENGDDGLSAILHQQNLLPMTFPKMNIGNNNATIRYSLRLSAAAPAAEVIQGTHWVVFKNKRGDEQ